MSISAQQARGSRSFGLPAEPTLMNRVPATVLSYGRWVWPQTITSASAPAAMRANVSSGLSS